CLSPSSRGYSPNQQCGSQQERSSHSRRRDGIRTVWSVAIFAVDQPLPGGEQASSAGGWRCNSLEHPICQQVWRALMELYTLDGLLRRTEIIEGYESFLWTDRYAGIGDFQIIVGSTQQNRNLLASGTLLGLSESKTVMKVETIIDKEDDEGRKLLTITGRE